MTTIATMKIGEKSITMEQEDIMIIMEMRSTTIAENIPMFIILTNITLMKILIIMLIILGIYTIQCNLIFFHQKSISKIVYKFFLHLENFIKIIRIFQV